MSRLVTFALDQLFEDSHISNLYLGDRAPARNFVVVAAEAGVFGIAPVLDRSETLSFMELRDFLPEKYNGGGGQYETMYNFLNYALEHYYVPGDTEYPKLGFMQSSWDESSNFMRYRFGSYLKFDFPIVGSQYTEFKDSAHLWAKRGKRIRLVREPENHVDSNAIRADSIYAGADPGERLYLKAGYLPRDSSYLDRLLMLYSFFKNGEIYATAERIGNRTVTANLTLTVKDILYACGNLPSKSSKHPVHSRSSENGSLYARILSSNQL